MSAVLIQSGTSQVWPVAERTFCNEAFAFVAAKRSDPNTVLESGKESLLESLNHSTPQRHESQKNSARAGGVWFTYQDKTLLWYPYAVEWICAPGSVDRRLRFSSKHKVGAGLGLRNRRNACFLNATVQALTYLPPLFCSAMKNRHSRHCVRKQRNLYCGLCEFESHIRTISAPRGVVSKALRLDAADIKFYPRLHSEMLHRFDISTRRQACAYEALTMILEWLRKYDLPPDLQTKFLKHSIPFPQLNTAYIGQVLGSVIEHRRTCLHCHEESIVHEIVNDYVLSLNGSKSLESALKRHFAPEDLDAANKSDCDKCKSKQRKRLEKRILVPPNVLVLVVKRSLWAPQDSLLAGIHGLTKDNRTLQVPKILDIKSLLTFGGEKATDESTPSASSDAGSYTQIEHKYQISSAVVHHGVPMAGHYVAVCQSPSGQYFKYNDEHVSFVPEEKLERELSKAYIYFYTRVSGGVPMPSKDQVTQITDTAVTKLKSLGQEKGQKKLSLIISISSSPVHPSSATTSSPSRVHTQNPRPSSPHTLSLPSRSQPNTSDAISTMNDGPAASEDEMTVELEDASTTTSSVAGGVPFDGSQYSSTSVGEDSGRSSPSNTTNTPRISSLSGSPRQKKARSLRENVAKFFKVSSSSDTREKHYSPAEATTNDADLSIPLLSNSSIPQWELDTLQDVGADAQRFQEVLASHNTATVNKCIPGNKRQQHDIEYDKGRSKKKKRLTTDTITLPNFSTFDRVQKGIHI